MDKKVIAAIYAECFDEPWAITAVDDLLRGKGCWAFILETGADDNCQAAGFVMGRSVLDETEILSIGVLSQTRQNGFARQLMQKAIEEAKTRGGANLFLEVAEDNIAARALYQQMGFEMIGRRKKYYLKADRSRVDALNLSLKI